MKGLAMAADVRQAFEVIFMLSCLITVYAKDVNLNADIFGALGDLAESLQTSSCEFKCPSGRKAYPNPNHEPRTNGCGSYGLKLDTSSFPTITKCCDKHDFCYDTCGSKRKKCDSDFKKCLKLVCQDLHDEGKLKNKEFEGCKTAAEVLHGGAMAFGCHAYQESQKEACICRRPSDL